MSIMRRRSIVLARRPLVSLAFVSIILLVLAVPGAGASVPSAPPAPDPKPAGTSRPTNPRGIAESSIRMLADDVKRYAEAKHPGRYVGGAWSADRDAITIYWNGSIPSDVRNFRQNSDDMRKIHFVDVPYSLADLQGEARRISTEYPYVVSAGPTSDYQKLVVQVDNTKTPVDLVDIKSFVPIVVKSSSDGFKPLYRFADEAPFWGGAWIYNPNTGVTCSTGFSVDVRTGGEGILSAAHCGGGQWTTPPNNNEPVGTVTRLHNPTDSMMLFGRTYAPAVYNDVWTSNSGLNVNGYIDPIIGDVTCDSGALSGEVCDARVVGINYFIGGIGPGYLTDVSGTHGYGSAGEGDSGGPNYSQGGFLYAQGLIVAGLESSQADCPPGSIPDTSRLCYYVIFHSNIEEVASALDVTLKIVR